MVETGFSNGFGDDLFQTIMTAVFNKRDLDSQILLLRQAFVHLC